MSEKPLSGEQIPINPPRVCPLPGPGVGVAVQCENNDPRTNVLRLFPPCACISHAQGSSGVVVNMAFVWRGRTKSATTRAGRALDLAVRLE